MIENIAVSFKRSKDRRPKNELIEALCTTRISHLEKDIKRGVRVQVSRLTPLRKFQKPA